MTLRSSVALVFGALFLAGCAAFLAADRSSVVKALWENGDPARRQWTLAANRAMAQDGRPLIRALPKDIKNYCPAYGRLNDDARRNFWVYLLSALSHFESGHDPAVTYRENFRDRHGNYVISRGLLQLSIESANGYGCGFSGPKELHVPARNLACGLRILSRWVVRDDVVSGRISVAGKARWRGAARYWSPFRSPAKGRQIAIWTRSLPFCR